VHDIAPPNPADVGPLEKERERDADLETLERAQIVLDHLLPLLSPHTRTFKLGAVFLYSVPREAAIMRTSARMADMVWVGG
jgi:hypothetical protein